MLLPSLESSEASGLGHRRITPGVGATAIGPGPGSDRTKSTTDDNLPVCQSASLPDGEGRAPSRDTLPLC